MQDKIIVPKNETDEHVIVVIFQYGYGLQTIGP